MKILKNDNPTGTSYWGGTVFASAKQIKEVIGIDYMTIFDEKTNYEFWVELEDGTVFTIYDYRAIGNVYANTELYYHIGSFTRKDTIKVVNELKKLGLKATY